MDNATRQIELPTAPSKRRGLTLIEVVVSTMIVGMMTVAALNSLGAATRSGMSTGNRAVALGLADDLMAEILTAEYDDLDDFHNHNEPLAGDHAGWTLSRHGPASVARERHASDARQRRPGGEADSCLYRAGRPRAGPTVCNPHR